MAPPPHTLTALLVLLLSGLCTWALRVNLAASEAGAVDGGRNSLGDGPGHGRLRFRPDGIFRIMQITDLHYGEDAGHDSSSDQVQAMVLSAEQPDLVVFSGDMVSGYVCKGGEEHPAGLGCGEGWFEARWRQLIAPVHAAGIPYAITLGNHDAEADLDRRQVVELDVTTGGRLSQSRQGPGAATGASNYFVDVHAPADLAADNGADVAAGGAQLAAARIWLLDSMDRFCSPMMFGWGCVAGDTVSWVNRTSRHLPPVPSLAFVHIPVPQFRNVWSQHPTAGDKQEGISCPLRDTGLFDLAREAGIHAIYSGHDHNNDYEGVLQGVRLAYGRKTGYGSYGPPQGWLRGARVVELRLGEDTAYSTSWIRQEDGSKATQKPSPEPKDMFQLMCGSDEFGQQHGQQEAGQQGQQGQQGTWQEQEPKPEQQQEQQALRQAELAARDGVLQEQ